jgi:hypothetical protein
MVKIGSVGGEIWWTGTEKQGPRRGQLGHVAPTCKLQAQVGAEFVPCKLGPP